MALALHWRWGYRASDADRGSGGDCDPVALHLPMALLQFDAGRTPTWRDQGGAAEGTPPIRSLLLVILGTRLPRYFSKSFKRSSAS